MERQRKRSLRKARCRREVEENFVFKEEKKEKKTRKKGSCSIYLRTTETIEEKEQK